MNASRGFAVACVALLAACAGDDPPRDPDAAAAPAPRVVALSSTEYAFEAPDSIPAGWTTLRFANLGGEIHYGHIVRLDSGRTVEDLVDAYAEAIRTSGPRPKWAARFGGPGGAAPGSSATVTQYLEPGDYVWICPIEDESGAPHFGKGEVKRFVVYEADEADKAAPEADIVVRLLDFDFTFEPPLRAGLQTIRVQNAGIEPHDLVLMKLAPGITADDVRTWLNPEIARRDAPAAEPPPLESLGTLAGGIAAIGPGRETFFDVDFTPGEYVLVCMATAPDGRSHIEHGMIRQVSVQ
ncbi:MAG TPA: hypothetical protein VFT04_03430 [Gemmatimonadales bacterium]|nr:hypothetical protein [Gemmatimonadales bacterium]